MPKPKPGESRNEYVSRCVPVVMGEGATQEQAVGKCEGMWNSYAGKAIQGEAFNVAVGESVDKDHLTGEFGNEGEELEKDLDEPQIDPSDANVAFPSAPEDKLQARRELGENGAERLTMPEEEIMVGKEEESGEEDAMDGEEWEEQRLVKPARSEAGEEEGDGEKAEKDMREMHEMSERGEGKNIEKARSVGGFESPEPGDIPEGEKKILAAAYAAARKRGYDKERSSKIAWGAVHNARKTAEALDDTLEKLAATDEFNEDSVGDQVAHLGPVAGEIRKIVCGKGK